MTSIQGDTPRPPSFIQNLWFVLSYCMGTTPFTADGTPAGAPFVAEMQRSPLADR